MANVVVKSKYWIQWFDEFKKEWRDGMAQYEIQFDRACEKFGLGLELETSFCKTMVVVKKIHSKGMARYVDIIKCQHAIVAVNEHNLIHLNFDQTLERIREAEWPKVLRFLDPKIMPIYKVQFVKNLSNSDEYGFDREEEYLVKHRRGRRRTHNREYTVEREFVQFISDSGGMEGLKKTYEKDRTVRGKLKAILQNGIPAAFRCSVWSMLVGLDKYKSKFDPQYYHILVEKECDQQTIHDINKDLQRTFPEHPFFRDPKGRQQLERILKAYAQHNANVGYCQSLNFIVATLLLHMEEEEAFWMFCCMMERYLAAENYSHKLVGTQVDLNVIKLLLAREVPQINQKLMQGGIHIEMFSVQWLLCAYTCTLPIETALRVWDWLFFKGPEVIFDVAIAILKIHEKQILKAKDYVHLVDVSRDLGRNLHDADTLMKVLGNMDLDSSATRSTFAAKFGDPQKLPQPIKFLVTLASKPDIYRKDFSWDDITKWRQEIRPDVEHCLTET